MADDSRRAGILDTLEPAERLAFVLHDLFAMPFDEIAEVVGRSTDATRQLASRARRRIQGSPAPQANRSRQREIVDAYLAAAREGNFHALMSLLDPNIVLLLMVLKFTVADGKIVEIEAIADRVRLRQLDLAVLG